MPDKPGAGVERATRALAGVTLSMGSTPAMRFLGAIAIAAVAALVLLPRAGHAGPGPCLQDGNTVTCTGDQSAGVLEPTDYASPPTQIFIIDSTTAITPVAGNSGVDASGDDVGLYDITVRAPNGIFITGDLAAGINAGLATGNPVPPFNGDVIVNSEANISANGTRMQGISAFVGGSGSVTVTSVGDITVNTNLDPAGFGEAINASVGDTGNVTVDTTGNITTTNAVGINAAANIGNVSITNAGDIAVSGDGVEAISANTVSGDISITSSGNISADGGQPALEAIIVDTGNISLSSTGNITTTNAQGISAVTSNGTVDVTNDGNVEVTGDDQHGILFAANNGNLSLTSTGNVTTNGVGAHGFASVFNGDVTITSEGDITASGDGSAGIYLLRGGEPAVGTLASITSTGDILATGAGSAGVFAGLDDNMFGSFAFTGNVSATGSAFQVEVGAGGAFFDLSGGVFAGGTGAAIDIPNVAGVENAFVTINTDASTTLTAASGTAVVSNAGATTINNSGLMDGSVLLRSGGNNRINNLAGATFAPDSDVIVGAGRFVVNDGTFSPFGLGTLGTTQVTGNLYSNEGATYQVDISDIGSDATSVDGQFTLNGTLDINATTPENTFAVNDVFSIADASGGIYGTFSSVTDNLANFEIVPLIARDRSQLAAVLTTDGIFTTGDCSAVAGVVVCSGNQSDGITNIGLTPDFASLTSNQLVVENLTQTVGAPSGAAAVEVLVNNPSGFFADIDTGVHGISTVGQGQRGIEVFNTGGAVSIESAGDISTLGRNANGIVGVTTGGGDVSITSSSDISTTAIDTHAVIGETQNENGGVTITNSGEIVTTGGLSKGLLASVREVGDISITNTGAIRTQHDSIYALARRGGNITIDNTADLASGGDNAIVAVVGDDDVGDGNITINSVGNLSVVDGESAGGIGADVEGDGDIDISSSGDITANGGFGSGITGRIGGVGDITIRSTGDIFSSSYYGILGSGGVNTLIEHEGNIDSGATGIFGSGGESLVINSRGNIDATAADFTGAIEANTDRDGTVAINHTGDIRVSLEGIGNTVIGSGILIETGSFFGTQAVDMNVDLTGDITFAEGLGIVDSAGFLDNQRLSAGVSLVSLSPRNMTVNVTGDITSTNANVHGVAAIFRTANPNSFGDIDITLNGDISVTGENADGVRTRGTADTTATVTIAGGSILGGTGESGTAVEFRGPSGSTGILNVDAGSIAALSGVAVRGLDGSETINNAGTITGSILLGGGVNSFNNLAGGRFNSGVTVDLGGGVLRNSGTIAPGSSIGTTNLLGGLVLESTGVLDIEIAGDGTADRIDATGTATIAGTLSVFGLGYPTGFPNAQTYTILTADGGVTGTFDTVTDNLPDVDVVATYSANAVNIGYTRDGTGPTPPNYSDKSILADSLEGGLLAGRLFDEMLQMRMNGLQLAASLGGRSMDDALGYASMYAGLGDQDSTIGMLGAAPGVSGDDNQVWPATAFWLGGLGGYGSVNESSVSPGFDQATGGLAAGFDFAGHMGSGTLLGGIAGGYSVSNLDKRLAAADIKTIHFGAYASFLDGPLLVSGALSYGFQNYEISRTIPIEGAAPAFAMASTSGGVFAASAQASYDIASTLGLGGSHGLRIAPVLSVDHVHVQRDGYVETGAGILNLTVDNSSFARTFLGAGLEFAARFETASGMIITPSGSVKYSHGFGADAATVNSSIAGAAAADFTDVGASLGDHILDLSAGLGISVSENVSVNAAYRATLSSSSTSHRGQISLRMKF
ncbi:autotransporter domain-containing protein [Oricola sp.]|uniref:beta strand repeat-containing protein n=1 Tax=Oricola sp. TaxID=1979950 RepID=UPI0026010843|nr:autotransporter domain-containing protein [Oricola sp.]MCI5075492.1 autotransporter domain-containing protein [Oricola sp.]